MQGLLVRSSRTHHQGLKGNVCGLLDGLADLDFKKNPFNMVILKLKSKRGKEKLRQRESVK